MIYQIATGDYRARQNGRNMTEAVVAAFKRRAPKAPGLLTRARTAGHRAKDGGWYYICTEKMLRRAGYKVLMRPI